jgi:putative ABC transport system permease protein
VIAIEVAVALLLLIGAGLLGRSFLHLSLVDSGYDPENVLVVKLDVGRPNYYNRYWECGDFSELLWRSCERSDETHIFYDRVVDEVETLPGVVSAALTDRAPLQSGGGIYPLRIETEASRAAAPESEEHLSGEARGRTDGALITPGYFDTMGARLLGGRDFRAGDRKGWEGVAVINQTLAHDEWPGESPLGKRLTFFGDGSWMTVIGVVEDTEDSNLADQQTYADGSRDRHVYHLGGMHYMTLVVRTRIDPALLIEPVREAVERIDHEMPIGRITTMNALSAASLALPRFFLSVLGFFAVAALALAILGLYGVIAYAVGDRTREIGLRMALGARAGQIRNMIVREALLPVLIGMVLGIGAGVALSRLLSSLLYGLSPHDPIAFVSLPLLLLAVALLASYFPARRASRLDPMDALRYE